MHLYCDIYKIFTKSTAFRLRIPIKYFKPNAYLCQVLKKVCIDSIGQKGAIFSQIKKIFF